MPRWPMNENGADKLLKVFDTIWTGNIPAMAKRVTTVSVIFGQLSTRSWRKSVPLGDKLSKHRTPMTFNWIFQKSKKWSSPDKPEEPVMHTWVTCLLCRTRRLHPSSYPSQSCPTCGHVAPALCDKGACGHLQCVIIHLTSTLDAVRVKLEAMERERG